MTLPALSSPFVLNKVPALLNSVPNLSIAADIPQANRLSDVSEPFQDFAGHCPASNESLQSVTTLQFPTAGVSRAASLC
jgi:hypothetical protein